MSIRRYEGQRAARTATQSSFEYFPHKRFPQPVFDIVLYPTGRVHHFARIDHMKYRTYTMPDGVRHSSLLVRRLDSPGISGSHALLPIGRLQQAAIGTLAFPLPRCLNTLL